MTQATHKYAIRDNGGVMRHPPRIVAHYKNRKRAQTRADRLNLEYGAHRYTVIRLDWGF